MYYNLVCVIPDIKYGRTRSSSFIKSIKRKCIELKYHHIIKYNGYKIKIKIINIL